MNDEHQNNPLVELSSSLSQLSIRSLMICLPGHIVSFDRNTQRAQVQCGLQRIVDGEPVTIPVITNVPVQFSGSASWTFYHELPAGTEGLIHFSQRAADTWIMQGGVSAPLNARMFSASDAFFSPGYRSEKTAIKSTPNSGMGMSNASGGVSIHLCDDGITMTANGSTMILNSAGLTVNADTAINGNASLNGSSATHNGTNIGKDHVHGGVETGRYNTGGPQ